jgi:hypothetical protein
MPIFDLPGKNILLHNRAGVRIELNLHDTGRLVLWLSPCADRAIDVHHRNFSNRDDHMPLFEHILLPGLTADSFLGCDYDAFAVTVRFSHQVLRLSSAWADPLVQLSVASAQAVDFAGWRGDLPVERTTGSFVLQHTERGMSCLFRADVAGGSFRHQAVTVAGRTTHARCDLAAGAMLTICGDSTERAPVLLSAARARLAQGYDASRNLDETSITAALGNGTITFAGQPGWQRITEVSRRVLLAMQDHQGAIRAAINRIYYLIWVRDGAIIEAFQAQAGQSAALGLWRRFLLANPTEVTEPGREGRMFGQLVNPITKWQEDGLFYAAWTVFLHWTQGGPRPTEVEMAVLTDALAWSERYAFDQERSLFGRYYACESPFAGSHDFGSDGAVGSFSDGGAPRCAGGTARRSYDVYVNVLNWNVYLMLAAMTDDAALASSWRAQAERLRLAMLPLFDGPRPAYGWIETTDGGWHRVDAFDRTDYQWAMTIAPFFPVAGAPGIRARLRAEAVAQPAGCFLAGWFSMLQSLDPVDHPAAELTEPIETAMRESHRPGEFLPMPDTVVEMLGMPDGHPYHDVRPQAFSIGPMLATITGLGLRRLPFGLAIRPTTALARLPAYQYGSGTLDVRWEPAASGVAIDGVPLTGTWQLPEDRLGGAAVVTCPAGDATLPVTPTLLASTMRLQSVAGRTYRFEAFGWNQMRFASITSVAAVDAAGNPLTVTLEQVGATIVAGFPGTGPVVVTVG